jgi:hypothetical protein
MKNSALGTSSDDIFTVGAGAAGAVCAFIKEGNAISTRARTSATLAPLLLIL